MAATRLIPGLKPVKTQLTNAILPHASSYLPDMPKEPSLRTEPPLKFPETIKDIEIAKEKCAITTLEVSSPTVDDKNKYTCEYCKKCFIKNSHLLLHLKITHNKWADATKNGVDAVK